jgi:L-fuconolactonase
MELIVDCHAHPSAGDPDRYPPSPVGGSVPDGHLADPMTAERLLGEMDANGVARAILVQRGSIYGYDNSYVCDSAEARPDRFKPVCYIDAADPEVSARAAYWVLVRGAVGLRLMEPQRGADLSWMGTDPERNVWRAARELDVPVCVHFFRWNRKAGLLALGEIAREFPGLPIIIDHFSNMSSEAGPPDHGLDEFLLDFVRFPDVYVKYTTIPLGHLDSEGIDAAPVVARVVAEFGANRVMWGSDVSQSKGSYEYMLDLARRSTALLSDAQRARILSGTTDSLYGR